MTSYLDGIDFEDFAHIFNKGKGMSVEKDHYPTTSDPNAAFLAAVRQALYDAKAALEMRPMNEPIGMESQRAIEGINRTLDLTTRYNQNLTRYEDKRNEELESFVDQIFTMYRKKLELTPDQNEVVRLRATELRLGRGKTW